MSWINSRHLATDDSAGAAAQSLKSTMDSLGSEPLSDLDQDACIEVLTELIQEDGEKVYRLFWDSGGPGAGADHESIYKFRDR